MRRPTKSRRPTLQALARDLIAFVAVALAAGCADRVVTRVLHRTTCEVCHQPLDARGIPTGIEDMHPWLALGCTDCHGGAARVCDGDLGGPADAPTCDGEWRYDKALAHPAPGPDVRGMTPAELDAVDPEWLRFVNPTDLRVVAQSCGRCHTAESADARRSGHALQTGDLAIARARSGLQATTTPRFGAVAQRDLAPDASDACTAPAVTQLAPLPIDPSSAAAPGPSAPTTGNAVDQLLVKRCLDCHTSGYGPPRDEVASGRHRSSGCAACHVAYAADGLTVGGDPWVPRAESGHPLRHVMDARPRMDGCLACHSGDAASGAQIGRSFRGEHLDLPGVDPTPTPPDVHFEAGMTCIDCHGAAELHGDGRIGGDHTCAAPRVACVDCHGTAAAEASVTSARERLARDGADVVLTTAAGARLPVPQLARATSAATRAAHAAGHDRVACSTCHAGWMPSCYGCHLDVDLGVDAAYLTNARVAPGRVQYTPLDAALGAQVLAWNARGELQGAMPAERVFVTLRVGDTVLLDDAPRVGADGLPAAGLRPIDPHTTRLRSPFAACDRCHSVGSAEAPANAATLEETYGFGSERHVHGGQRMDAVLASDGTPIVAPGHAGVRPLSLSDIDKMRAVLVPATASARSE